MPQIISTRQERPRDTQTVTLGDAQFRIRLTWRGRPGVAAWYFDLFALDSTPLVLGVRISPGWSPLGFLQKEGLPDGQIMVDGPEPYTREMLGGELLLTFYTTAEIAAEADAPVEPTLRVT